MQPWKKEGFDPELKCKTWHNPGYYDDLKKKKRKKSKRKYILNRINDLAKRIKKLEESK